MFSSGVPVIASLNRAGSRRAAAYVLAAVVLHELRLVEDQPAPRQRAVVVLAEPQQRVRGDDQVGAVDRLGQRHAQLAAGRRRSAGRRGRARTARASRAQFDTTLVGATTSTGAVSSPASFARQTSASACSVLPSPMSSASMPPSPASHRTDSHWKPSLLVGPQLRGRARPGGGRRLGVVDVEQRPDVARPPLALLGHHAELDQLVPETRPGSG